MQKSLVIAMIVILRSEQVLKIRASMAFEKNTASKVVLSCELLNLKNNFRRVFGTTLQAKWIFALFQMITVMFCIVMFCYFLL